jgi:Uncharacterised protein family (UPF0175)
MTKRTRPRRSAKPDGNLVLPQDPRGRNRMALGPPLCYPHFMRVNVEIPDQFVQYLVPAGRDASRALLEEAVAGAYRAGRLTMEQVRQLLGFGTRMQADSFLQLHEIYDYTVEDLDKDMATLNRLLATKSR